MLFSGIDLDKRSLVIHTLDADRKSASNGVTDSRERT
jgi:hypothetical protein